MSQQQKGKAGFDISAAIQEIEAKKEATRQRKILREKERIELQKEKEESKKVAEQEKRLRFFEDERYFRLSLIDSIGALTREVAHLRGAIESSDRREDSGGISEMMKILRTLESCIDYSDYSGLSHIRAKYIPKDYS